MYQDSTFSLTTALLMVLRGILMGGADVIPGVSGGTVALIVGIYYRLVTAISRFDRDLLLLLARRQFGKALAHIDGLFLICLGLGIGTGIVGLGGVVNDMLAHPATRCETLAAFFGMILASCVVVARMIKVRSVANAMQAMALAVAAAIVAYLISSATPHQVEQPSPLFVFACGVVAICAMILPGISGAYVLVILGVYAYLTDILKGLRHLDLGSEQLVALVAMAAGCSVGLLSFSRLLRWLLANQKDLTLSALCGLMVGAITKVWPFQIDLNPEQLELKHKQFRNVMPETIDTQVWGAIAIGTLAMIGVLLVHSWASRRPDTELGSPGR